MKRNNKLMRASGFLLILTLITSCFVGGTFAKYVSRAEASDSARVAKWGVVISNGNDQGEDGVFSGDAFSTIYQGTVVDSVKSENGDKVIAPGTEGAFEMLKITGTPEVAVEIDTVADVKLTGDWVDAGGNFYCPLVFTINGVEQTITATSAEDFETKLEGILTQYTNTEDGKPIPAGTDLSQSTSTNELPVLFRPDVDLEWKWLFDVSEENDIKDTYLGDIAAGSIEGKTAPNIEITFETTVTQVD